MYTNDKTRAMIECIKAYNIKAEPPQILLVRESVRNMARPTGN